MNILKQLTFSDEKPAVLTVRKSEKLNIRAIGLKKDQLLKKHHTPIPALLTVLQGSIHFHIGEEVLLLQQLDTYEIPVNVEHEVTGVGEQNIFMLVQER